MSSKASFLDANVVKILVNPKKEWLHHRRKTLGAKRFASFDKKVDWEVFNPKDYLFTHSTIVSSVKVEPNGYRIVDPCHELINANGNAWSNEVLMNCFRTFIGKPNFYEHFQIQGFEKGVILDSILRPVTYVGSNGKTADVFYVDLLIATNRKHDDIVRRIIDGSLSTLSMGCTCSIVQCSYCGKIFEEDEEECEHLQNHIGELLLDQYGHKVPVAELIGVMKDGKFVEGSCEFIEASWVEQPAFEGAVLNQFLYEEDVKKNLEAQRFARFDFNSYFNYDTLNQLRVADKYSYVTIQLLKEQLLKEKYLNIAKEVYKSNNK